MANMEKVRNLRTRIKEMLHEENCTYQEARLVIDKITSELVKDAGNFLGKTSLKEIASKGISSYDRTQSEVRWLYQEVHEAYHHNSF